ncbi:exonuclease domain-containing protein [Shewanella cyperi]|uniref:exonuclease domain-containing protein n=1 Tax=Shewanella cyperi TaxID=2814292 RepID=UPI001A947FF4|nr:exonuclease domain-containing protein [Shewanella cyperi]QSX42638.1 3'-5' exonuclease [Shewanella cyperi]
MNELALNARMSWRARRLHSQRLRHFFDSQRQLLSRPLEQVPILALDMEMTGLDPAKDQILAMGLVPVFERQIHLEDAASVLVSIDGSVGHSATIHGITDLDLTGGLTPAVALDWLLERAEGHILLAHHAPLDLAFLQQAAQRLLGERLPLLAIDTLALERQRLLRSEDVLKEGSLRLDACRSRYGLPRYAAHNALTDALACAELFLAQSACLGKSLHCHELARLYR